MRKCFTLSLFMLFGGIAVLRAQVEISPIEVAEALGGSQESKLVASDNLEPAKRQSPGIIWSKLFHSESGDFPIVTLTIGQGRSLLTDQLKSQMLEASQRKQVLPSGEAGFNPVQKIDIDQSEGFIFPSGFGPEGSYYTALVTTKDGRFDYAFRLSFPAEQTAQSTNAQYLALASAGEKGISNALVSAFRTLYPKMASISEKGSPSTRTGSEQASAPVKEDLPAKAPGAQPPVSDPLAGKQERGWTFLWILVFGIVGISLLVIFRLRIRK